MNARMESPTAEQLRSGIVQLQAHLNALTHRVGHRVHDFRGDEYRAVRDLLVWVVGELERLEQHDVALLLAQVESRPVVEGPGERRREIGVSTGAWRRGEAPMRRNRGHL